MELTNKVINSFLCLCASAALGAGGMYLYHKDKINSSGKDKLISECESILSKNGVKLPEGAEPEKDALRGYLSSYGDPYTFYRGKKEQTEDYVKSINNFSCLRTCGYKVGVSEDGRLEVISVTADSAAEKQGLKVGDIILSINGDSIKEKGMKPTASNLLGKDGTEMDLIIERNGTQMPLHFVRVNDMDNVQEIVEMKVIGDSLYVQIAAFDMMAPMAFKSDHSELGTTYKNVIFDVRDNSGGDARIAVEMADYFVGNGKVELCYYSGKKETLETHDDDADKKTPYVVICNENTASAAEIFTALLKQYGGDVKLIGTKTYGKGIFQLDEELSDGGTLCYTAGYYTVGDWECYQGIGITPDTEVEMDHSLIGTDEDIQLKKALELVG